MVALSDVARGFHLAGIIYLLPGAVCIDLLVFHVGNRYPFLSQWDWMWCIIFATTWWVVVADFVQPWFLFARTVNYVGVWRAFVRAKSPSAQTVSEPIQPQLVPILSVHADLYNSLSSCLRCMALALRLLCSALFVLCLRLLEYIVLGMSGMIIVLR